MPHISCREAFSKLADYLDRELSPSELQDVEAHLEICRVCAREFAFEEALLAGLKAKLRRARLPDALRRRIFDALREETGYPGAP